jgi:hypothetical protein
MKEQYLKLAKKFNLPKFTELDQYFSITELDEEKLSLKAIRKCMFEKLSHILGDLQEILQPDTHFTSMYEAKTFSDSDREELYIIFKTLKSIERESNLISINETEIVTSAFIKSTFTTWKNILPNIENFYKKLQEVWLKQDQSFEDNNYLG